MLKYNENDKPSGPKTLDVRIRGWWPNATEGYSILFYTSQYNILTLIHTNFNPRSLHIELLQFVIRNLN
jgi:hypothetical protein